MFVPLLVLVQLPMAEKIYGPDMFKGRPYMCKGNDVCFSGTSGGYSVSENRGEPRGRGMGVGPTPCMYPHEIYLSSVLYGSIW